MEYPCRFCHDTSPPLITPCNCQGSVKYIHKKCILRWATIDGTLDLSKFTCSLCMSPYHIAPPSLETFVTDSSTVNMLLYHSTPASIIINYLSILIGIHTGQTISERLMAAHLCIYILYVSLYCVYVRIQNMDLYATIAYDRRSYMYGLIQVYSSYACFTEQYALMSITAMLAHTVLWREHVTILELVNESLLKNE